MEKNGVVTISEWYKGMAKYPLQGFGLFRNVDVTTNPGIVTIEKGASLDFTPDGIPVAYAKNGSDIWTLAYNDSTTSSLYKNGVVVQSGLSNARDLLIYNNYILVSYSNYVGVYGPLSSGSAQWWSDISAGALSLNGSVGLPMIIGQDNIIYVGAGKYVATITFVSSGTPGTIPTVTVQSQALDLPDGNYATSIAEVGKFLAIGTQTAGIFQGPSNEGRVYLWDRVSASVLLPVRFNEDRVHALYSHANRLFVVAGSKGNVYQSDGTNYTRIGQIPFTTLANNTTLSMYPNAIDLSQDGKLLIGTSTGTNSDPSSATKHGVWELDVMQQGAPIVLKHTVSTGSLGQTTPLYIGAIKSTTDVETLIGFQDASVYGSDRTSNTPYDNYGGEIESQLVQVGTALNKRTFEHIEWTLSEPLVDGQGIRISYRKNLSEDWTEIGDWTYATEGAVTSREDRALIADAEFVQLKIELNQDSTTDTINNVNLIRVQLW